MPKLGWTKGTPLERFMAKVDKTPHCWLWRGFRNNYGYGQFWYEKRMAKAHRFSYEHHVGPVPAGLLVMHICDNPSCVNPSHLQLGTPKMNSHDAVKKGRVPQGDKRLTEEKAALLVRMLKLGIPSGVIARGLEVAPKTVARWAREVELVG